MKSITKTMQVIMLSANNQESTLWDNEAGGKLHYYHGGRPTNIIKGLYKPQHLYLVSDAEIKDGDWYIANNRILQASLTDIGGKKLNYYNGKKIEATTDSSLNDCNCLNPTIGSACSERNRCVIYPKIHQSFVEAYAKSNGSIKEVQVEVIILCKNCGKEENTHRFTVCPNKLHLSIFDNSKDKYFDGEQIVKTRPDNTVIVHISDMPEPNLYTSEEVHKALLDCTDWVRDTLIFDGAPKPMHKDTKERKHLSVFVTEWFDKHI